MKRRDFIGATIGAAAFTPLAKSHANSPSIKLGPAPALVPTPIGEAGKWFMEEPTRIGWFTLRYSDAADSAEDFVQQAADARMNLICLTVGGSFAFYPSRITFHEWAPNITDANDFLGRIVKAAKEKNIRIAARFDFSKQSPRSVQAHPEWFFTNADGSHPKDASGRTPPCINGDFFRKQAVEIVKEVIERYQPAMIYLNNFGNNLGGQNLPDPCHCANCRKKFRDMTGSNLPSKMTDQVRLFLRHCTYDTGKIFFDTVQRLSPSTVFINADTTPTHGWHSETRMLIAPSHVWLYVTSEAVNRQRTSFPFAVTCNNVTSYSSNASRLALMPQQETRLRLYQAIAHGSPPTYVATGTMKQHDVRDVNAAVDVFKWHAINQDIFGGTTNAARVLLLVAPEVAPRGRSLRDQHSWRGLYRILTEKHIPVAVSEVASTEIISRDKYDLVIISRNAESEGVKEFVEAGGNAIYVDERPKFVLGSPTKSHRLVNVAYAEIKDIKKFPSLNQLQYVMLTSMCPYDVIDIFSKTQINELTFDEFAPEENAPLTFVPPMIENPAEVSQSDLQHTKIPALLLRSFGKGRIAYLPWDLGALYDRMALPVHADLFNDLFDMLTASDKQIKTNAHSSVEMVLLHQKKTRRHLLHLVNLSGQTQNNYMDAIPMRDVQISITGKFSKVSTRMIGTTLSPVFNEGFTTVTLPLLNEYEVLVLEQ